MQERDKLFMQLGAIFVLVLTLLAVAGLRHSQRVTSSALDIFVSTAP